MSAVIANQSLDWYRAHGFRYAIASSLLYTRYLSAAYPVEQSFYLTLLTGHTVFRIAPSSDASGPALQVVDLHPPP